MTIRGILFDKDGTLLDFEATWGPLYRALALELAGGDPETAQAMLVAGGLDPVTGKVGPGSALGAGTALDVARLWFPKLRDRAFQAMAERIEAAFQRNSETGSVAVPELVETLRTLAARGYALGIATNDATLAARASMKHLGADVYLPHIFGYDSVPRAKPAPDLVHAFAEAIGAPPAEIAVVGDNALDLEMARAAGAGIAIGVVSGNSSAEELAPAADIVVAGIRDLPGLKQFAGRFIAAAHAAS